MTERERITRPLAAALTTLLICSCASYTADHMEAEERQARLARLDDDRVRIETAVVVQRVYLRNAALEGELQRRDMLSAQCRSEVDVTRAAAVRQRRVEAAVHASYIACLAAAAAEANHPALRCLLGEVAGAPRASRARCDVADLLTLPDAQQCGLSPAEPRDPALIALELGAGHGPSCQELASLRQPPARQSVLAGHGSDR